jgi:hypothetical protein
MLAVDLVRHFFDAVENVANVADRAPDTQRSTAVSEHRERGR